MSAAWCARRVAICGAWVLCLTMSAAQAAAPLADADAAEVDALIDGFMEHYEIPAWSIAIAKNGRLVFAKAYGHADAEGALPVTPEHVFRIASVSKPLTSAAVIETVTGLPYEQALRELLLEPAGVRDMHIAGDRLGDRRPNEVMYDPPSKKPHGMQVARMDAHGGWVAGPTDLLRIVVRVDGFDTVPDLLTADSLRVMSTPSKANPYHYVAIAQWQFNPLLPSNVNAQGWERQRTFPAATSSSVLSILMEP